MGRKPITDSEITIAICYGIMNVWDFSYKRRLEWEIWAAKFQPCPTCPAPSYSPCLNMTDIKSIRAGKKINPRQNKRAHDSRIDWNRLLNGLKSRGYYRPAIETQVRNQVR